MKLFFSLLVLIIVAFAILARSKNKILLFLARWIKKKNGLDINVSTFELTAKGIILKGIFVTRCSMHIEIDFIRIWVRLKPPFIGFQVRKMEMLLSALNTPYKKDHHSQQDEVQLPTYYLNRLILLLQKKSPKIFGFAKIEVKHLCLFFKTKALLHSTLMDFNFKRQKAEFVLNNFGDLLGGYRISMRLRHNKILYSCTFLDSVSKSQICVPHLTGKAYFSVQSKQLIVSAYARSLSVMHSGISRSQVVLHDLNINLVVDQFIDRIELNSESFIRLNNINFEIKARVNDHDGLFSILLYLDAQIESLLHLIPNLHERPMKEFRSRGRIYIGLSLGFLWNDPLSYKFKLDYDAEGVEIISPGVDLNFLRQGFIFISMINSKCPHEISVKASLEKSTGLELLSNIIQLSEDPNFYDHNGVDCYFVGVAIAQNLARRQFYKGASTLSMQLIKNLLLGEERSLARKLEELIITLLMENYFDIPKNRILEIYLQIIEFGPKIYGVNAASGYYFNKNVSELNLLECLIISYIIPRPRFFLEAFVTKSEQLDRNLSSHIQSQTRLLLAKGLITREDCNSIGNKIKLGDFGIFELRHLNMPLIS